MAELELFDEVAGEIGSELKDIHPVVGVEGLELELVWHFEELDLALAVSFVFFLNESVLEEERSPQELPQ